MAKPYIITGLDIGTSTIKMLVVKKRPKERTFEILAQVEENSSGIRRGVVINVEEVSEIISLVLKKAQEFSGQRIKSVYVNVGGSHISVIPSQGLISVSRADRKISQEDVERVIQAAQTFSLPSNREILDVFPREFIVDEEKGIKEPLGMQGVRLGVEVLVLCGFVPYLKNLNQAILNAGLQIDDLIVSPLASAWAVLSPREKELGVALLDIGAGTSSLAVFEEGDLIHVAIFPIGSGHITNDIAIGLRTDIDTAERIKLEFGSCIFQGDSKKVKIKEESLVESLIFSKKLLTKIIEARVSEIFSQVKGSLKQISRQNLLPAGIVLTGGGSKLPKITELCKKELKLSARIGKPGKEFSPLQNDPRLSTLCGLVLLGADFETEKIFPTFDQGIRGWLKRIFKIFIP